MSKRDWYLTGGYGVIHPDNAPDEEIDYDVDFEVENAIVREQHGSPCSISIVVEL